jgi:hypothetical protein
MAEQSAAPYTAEDLAYVRSEYLTLPDLVAGRVEDVEQVDTLIGRGRLPGPAYVLPDGTPVFPPDYFHLLDEAGGVDELPTHFERLHSAALARYGDVSTLAEDWAGYLSGDYGVCLRQVTPERMVEKSALIARITELVAAPDPDDRAWLEQLCAAVDRLDDIERPFTDHDRLRWGGTSRDTNITAVRAGYLSGTPAAC